MQSWVCIFLNKRLWEKRELIWNLKQRTKQVKLQELLTWFSRRSTKLNIHEILCERQWRKWSHTALVWGAENKEKCLSLEETLNTDRNSREQLSVRPANISVSDRHVDEKPHIYIPRQDFFQRNPPLFLSFVAIRPFCSLFYTFLSSLFIPWGCCATSTKISWAFESRTGPLRWHATFMAGRWTRPPPLLFFPPWNICQQSTRKTEGYPFLLHWRWGPW